MDALRGWAQEVALPWLAESRPKIITGAVFALTLWLLTFYGADVDDDDDDDDTL